MIKIGLFICYQLLKSVLLFFTLNTYIKTMDKQETIEEAKLRAANYMSLKGALKPKQESNFYEKLKQYFEETPREKVLEDWAKSAEYNKVGPTIDDFLNNTKEKMYSEEEMINFAEFVATYADKNRNVNGEMLHAKSKYDGAERTIDLLEIWFEQFKKK